MPLVNLNVMAQESFCNMKCSISKLHSSLLGVFGSLAPEDHSFLCPGDGRQCLSLQAVSSNPLSPGFGDTDTERPGYILLALLITLVLASP